jgi:Domain of unknown function (DUF4439)
MTASVLDSLQAALDGENAAMYAYSYLGGKEAGTAESNMRAAFEDHRTQRDVLQAAIVATNATPNAALPAYALPAGSAPSVLLGVENRCCALYTNLIDATSGSDAVVRAGAITALTTCALWASHWSRTTAAFPGLMHEPS